MLRVHEELVEACVTAMRRVLNNVLRSGGVGGADDVGHALHEAVGMSELAAVLGGDVGKSFGVILVAHDWWSPPIRRARLRYESRDGESRARRRSNNR